MAQIQSGSTSDLLTIDTLSKAARVSLYDDQGNSLLRPSGTDNTVQSGMVSHGINDETQRALRVDRMGNQASASYGSLVNDSFANATVHATRWVPVSTTMTASISAANGYTLNSGSITTVSTGYLMKTARSVTKVQKAPMFLRARAKMTPVNNSQMFIGYTDGTSATAVGSNYVGFEVTSAGLIRPVWVVGGSTIAAGSDFRSSLTLSNFYVYDVWLDDDDAYFFVQDTTTGLIVNSQTLTLPASAARYLASSATVPAFHLFNTGSAPATAPQLQVTEFSVGVIDMSAVTKPWNHQTSGMDMGATQDPFTGAQSTNFSNSAAASSATLSNTAAGYTTLGGNFQFAAVAGAQTDYALFAYTVPTGRNLYVESITVDTYNTGAAVASTPHVLQWFTSANSTAVTLASNTFRRHLGIQNFAVGAAIGAQANSINVKYDTPLFTASGRIFHVGLRVPVGTATASQVIVGSVGIHGYFE